MKLFSFFYSIYLCSSFDISIIIIIQYSPWPPPPITTTTTATTATLSTQNTHSQTSTKLIDQLVLVLIWSVLKIIPSWDNFLTTIIITLSFTPTPTELFSVCVWLWSPVTTCVILITSCFQSSSYSLFALLVLLVELLDEEKEYRLLVVSLHENTLEKIWLWLLSGYCINIVYRRNSQFTDRCLHFPQPPTTTTIAPQPHSNCLHVRTADDQKSTRLNSLSLNCLPPSHTIYQTFAKLSRVCRRIISGLIVIFVSTAFASDPHIWLGKSGDSWNW